MPNGWQKYLPYLFVLMFGVMRLPGVNTQGFSFAYALVFCAAAYPRLLNIWIVLAVIFGSDVWLNAHWGYPMTDQQLLNYVGYGAIYLLGRMFRKRTNVWRMVGGGFVAALIFYIVSNTGSWLSEPLYPKTLAGWWQALTTGLPGWPPTWTFFRNTMLSGGLFSGVVAAVLNCLQPAEPEPEEAEESEEAPEPAEGEEQAKA